MYSSNSGPLAQSSSSPFCPAHRITASVARSAKTPLRGAPLEL